MLSPHCNNTVNYFSTQFLIPVSIFSDFEPSQNTKIKKLKFKKFQSENSKNLKEEKSKSENPKKYREKEIGHEAYTPCLTGVGHSRSTTTGMNIKTFLTKIYGF